MCVWICGCLNAFFTWKHSENEFWGTQNVCLCGYNVYARCESNCVVSLTKGFVLQLQSSTGRITRGKQWGALLQKCLTKFHKGLSHWLQLTQTTNKCYHAILARGFQYLWLIFFFRLLSTCFGLCLFCFIESSFSYNVLCLLFPLPQLLPESPCLSTHPNRHHFVLPLENRHLKINSKRKWTDKQTEEREPSKNTRNT